MAIEKKAFFNTKESVTLLKIYNTDHAGKSDSDTNNS
jgi:hypothetical protein